MSDPAHDAQDLSRIYRQRFERNLEYRKMVWQTLIEEWFRFIIPPDSAVLDLGAGYGEFINQFSAAEKHAMDLNPDTPKHLSFGVKFHCQDCSQPWPLAQGTLDAVFTSNFFEHLPDKHALGRTLNHIHSALKRGGVVVAMGPNVKHVPGAYWDFWDHYVPLTELSLREALENRGFVVEKCIGRFLPYTMAGRRPAHPLLIKMYLRMPFVWPLLGRQFLVVARKP